MFRTFLEQLLLESSEKGFSHSVYFLGRQLLLLCVGAEKHGLQHAAESTQHAWLLRRLDSLKRILDVVYLVSSLFSLDLLNLLFEDLSINLLEHRHQIKLRLVRN